jgi:hypothetical protein
MENLSPILVYPAEEVTGYTDPTNQVSVPNEKKKLKTWKSQQYWIDRGFSASESNAIVNFDQKRFNYDECKRLFGLERSELVFQTREQNLKRVTRASPFSPSSGKLLTFKSTDG